MNLITNLVYIRETIWHKITLNFTSVLISLGSRRNFAIIK